MTSLNPVMNVETQLTEAMTLQLGITSREAKQRSVELLETVGINDPERRVKQYPHEFSGGMRQRVMVAIALSCEPKLIIADEPTTALDVTIQAQILDLIDELQQRTGTALLLITHDLGVIAEMADRVVVMYAGSKVEEAPVEALFERPLHPYTIGLLASVPSIGRYREPAADQEQLAEIPGTVPGLSELPRGCAFAPRCALANERCRSQAPPLEEKRAGHAVSCWEAVP